MFLNLVLLVFHRQLLRSALAPIVLTVPVQWRLGLNFDVSVDLHLAGESQCCFVADSSEERQRVQSRHREFLVEALMRNVLEPFLDDDATTRTNAQTKAVHIVVRDRIELDSCANGFAAQVGSNRHFHGFLFVDECDCWHDGRAFQNNRGIS